ncbi:universal stress protein [Humibacter sp. BT305]|nr:universal stress protein [Humibacter sp. BT305]
MNNALIVGVDGTVASRTALRWALVRATLDGKSVHLVHVVDDEWGCVGSSALRELHAIGAGVLRREVSYAHGTMPEVDVTSELLVGHPITVLGDLSASSGAAIVGTHKSGFFHGRVFGSRSIQLAAVVRCPLFVIPSDSQRQRRHVVVGVDNAAMSGAAIAFAAREAARLDQDLVLLKAGPGRGEMDDTRALDAAVEVARRSTPDTTMQVRRTAGRAGERLAAASESAMLTVVGRPQRRMPVPLGGTSTDLLLNMGGPVAVVPCPALQSGDDVHYERPVDVADRAVVL